MVFRIKFKPRKYTIKAKNLNYAYLSEDSDYVVIIIEPVSTNGRKYFCILSREVYEQNKELIFSVQSNRHNISEDILDTSEYRIMVYRSGIVDVPTSIWERIVEKGDLPEIDHLYFRSSGYAHREGSPTGFLHYTRFPV